MKDFKILPAAIVRKEVDSTHYYFVNDVWYPGVTSILDQASPMEFGLRQFLKNNTPEDIDRIKEETGDFGSLMHGAFEKLLYGMPLATNEYSERGKKIMTQFSQWFEIVHPKKYLPEHIVAYNAAIGTENDPATADRWAGTLDLIGTFSIANLKNVPNLKLSPDILAKETIRAIVDFKTTSGIYNTHKRQVMGYKMAVEQMYGIEIDTCFIARFGTRHKCGYEMQEVVDTTEKDWLRTFDEYKFLNGGRVPEPPLIDVYPDVIQLVEPDMAEEVQ